MPPLVIDCGSGMSNEQYNLYQMLLREGPNVDRNVLYKRAEKINALMCESHLTLEQAKAYTVQGTLIWLLQGQTLVCEGRLLPEIYLKIASFVTGCSEQATLNLMSLVNNRVAEQLEKARESQGPQHQYVDPHQTAVVTDRIEQKNTHCLKSKIRHFFSHFHHHPDAHVIQRHALR